MTDYSWLPYWLFGVVFMAFGFWLRGLYERTLPASGSTGASYDAMYRSDETEPLDEYDLMREKWLSLRFHADTLDAQNSLRVTDEQTNKTGEQ